MLTHADPALKEERLNNYDQSKKRIDMASNASWNAQNGLAKPNNSVKQDAFKLKQKELESNVLEQTDYSEFKPLNKRKADINNRGHKVDGPPMGSPQKRPDKGLMSSQSNWLNTTDMKRQVAKDVIQTRTEAKFNEQRATFDRHSYRGASMDAGVDDYQWKKSNDIPTTVKVTAKEKQRFLSSHLNDKDAFGEYRKTANYPKAGEVIDIDIKGLPANCDENTLKKAANARHVISAEIKQDICKGICTGEGRLKIRLKEGETAESVRANFTKAGYQATYHQDDPRKRPDLTGPKKDRGEHHFYGAKQKKEFELATKF